MSDLSVLAQMVKKMQGMKNVPHSAGQRAPFGTTQKGFARGAKMSTGAVPFKGRNPYAGEQKEQEFMRSPIMKAYLRKSIPRTPISDWSKGQG